jgi:hypothetical protein
MDQFGGFIGTPVLTQAACENFIADFPFIRPHLTKFSHWESTPLPRKKIFDL